MFVILHRKKIVFMRKHFNILILPAAVAFVIVVVMLVSYLHAPDENQPDYSQKAYIHLIGSPLKPDNVSDYIWVSPQFNATDVPPGNYSGLVRLAGNHYAVVSDAGTPKGYYNFSIDIDTTGQITAIRNNGFRKLGDVNDDQEAVTYDADCHHIYIGNEETAAIEEFDALNGRKLNRQVISDFKRLAVHNRIIESLTYDPTENCLYTCNEGPLRGDPGQMIRIRKFDTDLHDTGEYTYVMDDPLSEVKIGDNSHAFGVAELLAIGDGTLLVLEREFLVAPAGIGSWVVNKIFRFKPGVEEKQYVTGWRTQLNVDDFTLANYEGMCLGPKLPNGRQVVILCADSQNRVHGVLRDWFRTILI